SGGRLGSRTMERVSGIERVRASGSRVSVLGVHMIGYCDGFEAEIATYDGGSGRRVRQWFGHISSDPQLHTIDEIASDGWTFGMARVLHGPPQLTASDPTGAVRWTRTLPKRSLLAAAGDGVVLGEGLGTEQAFDSATGRRLWSTHDPALFAAAVVSGHVIVSAFQGTENACPGGE